MKFEKCKKISLFLILSMTILPIFQNCSGFKTLDFLAESQPLAAVYAAGLKGSSSTLVESQSSRNSSQYGMVNSETLIPNLKNNQVYQRQASASLNGKTAHDAAVVPLRFKKASSGVQEVRVSILMESMILFDKTYSVAEASVEEFEFPLLLSAGGWYSLQIRQIDSAQKKIYFSDVSKFGVGDVYLIAGQSNAAQHAEVKTASKNSKVVMADPEHNTWAPAADPLPFATVDPNKVLIESTNGKGQGSNWPELGDMLAQKYNVPVAFLNTAVGGTAITQWLPGAQPLSMGANLENVFKDYHLYQRLVFAAKYLQDQSGGFKMILWHQGESDMYAEECTPSTLERCAATLYAARFLDLKGSFDGAIGMNSSWMVARTTFGPDRLNDGCVGIQPYREYTAQQLRSSQERLWSYPNIYRGPESDDLREGYRYSGPAGSCIHFSFAGQKAMAQRWFASVVAAHSGAASPIVTPTPAPTPRPNPGVPAAPAEPLRLVDRSQAKDGFVTSFDMEVYGAGKNARACMGLATQAPCTNYVLMTTAWGAESYRAVDGAFIHKSNVAGRGFPMGNYYLSVKKENGETQRLAFTPKDNTVIIEPVKLGLLRLVDRSQAKDGFVTSFDMEVYGAGKNARACMGLATQAPCTNYVLMTTAWGAESYRAVDGAFIHKSNVVGHGFPMGNYYLSVKKENGETQRLAFTPKDNTVIIEPVKLGLLRLVDRSQAKDGFVTSFDMEVYGAGKNARACMGLATQAPCTNYVLMTTAWGAESYRAVDGVFIHKSNVAGRGFPMGNYYLSVKKENGETQRLDFTPKNN